MPRTPLSDRHMKRRRIATDIVSIGMVLFVIALILTVMQGVTEIGSQALTIASIALSGLAALAGLTVFLLRIGHNCVFHNRLSNKFKAVTIISGGIALVVINIIVIGV